MLILTVKKYPCLNSYRKISELKCIVTDSYKQKGSSLQIQRQKGNDSMERKN